MHDSPTSRDKRDKKLLLHSKINGGGKWGKIKNRAAQGPIYGKYLGRCADRIFYFGQNASAINFFVPGTRILATWANRKCQAYRMMPESLITDVDRLNLYILSYLRASPN